MKVLIVCHYFLPHMGGIEKVVYHEALGLTGKKYQVTILTSQIPDNSPFPQHPEINLIRTPAVNIFEKYFGVPYPIFYPSLLWKSYQAVNNTDIVHVHGHFYLSTFAACLWAKILHKKIILTQQNTFVEHKIFWVRWLEKLADLTVGKYTVKSADIIIAASHQTAAYVNQITPVPDKTVILYNGVDEKHFSPARSKSNIRKKLHLPDKFICFTIRRITFKNGVDTFLDTAKSLSGHRDIYFVLGGTGPDLPAVRKYIRDNQLKNIRLAGFISDSALPDFYRAADVFILPSGKGEGFPLVVLEAMSSGVAVIATRSGGHVEIIRNGINGYLCEVKDTAAISGFISSLYHNRTKLVKMSVNCRRLVMDKFSWSRHVRQLTDIYKKIYETEK